jgi:hypothetical protein
MVLAPLVAGLLRRGEPVTLATVNPGDTARLLATLTRHHYIMVTEFPAADTPSPEALSL